MIKLRKFETVLLIFKYFCEKVRDFEVILRKEFEFWKNYKENLRNFEKLMENFEVFKKINKTEEMFNKI